MKYTTIMLILILAYGFCGSVSEEVSFVLDPIHIRMLEYQCISCPARTAFGNSVIEMPACATSSRMCFLGFKLFPKTMLVIVIDQSSAPTFGQRKPDPYTNINNRPCTRHADAHRCKNGLNC